MLGFQAYTIDQAELDKLRSNVTKHLGVTNLHSYLPIYERFFNFDPKSRITTTIKSKYLISEIQECEGDNGNHFNTLCRDLFHSTQGDSAVTTQDVFYKLCPLVDPLDYVLGEDATINSALSLPTPFPDIIASNVEICNNPHNRAYTDAFFVYLSSRLVNNYNFIPGLQYYGVFTGIKNDFRFNFSDDISEPWESDSFMEGIDNRFILDADYLKEGFLKMREMINSAKVVKPPLGDIKLIISPSNKAELDIEEITIDSALDNQLSNQPSQPLAIEEITDFPNYDEVQRLIDTSSDESGGSDRTSVTTDDDSHSSHSVKKLKITNIQSQSDSIAESAIQADDSDWSDIESDDNSSGVEESSNHESSSEEPAWCTIPKIAVAIIAQERLTGTLEDLMEQEELGVDEWRSCLFQVCANLYTYNKVFDFVHNDLHAANIMWVGTDCCQLNYTIEGVEYSVPTYGRIFKIIDFGRATYRFGGLSFINDCFETGRDAATQYNYGRIFDETKTKCEPNYAFDLCRLATSIYDYFDNQGCYDNEHHALNDVATLVESWCLDDNGKHILYKASGAERYPGFKLYRMIARKVSHHVPQRELKNKTFKVYQSVPTSNSQVKCLTINIDLIKPEHYKS